MKSASTNLIAHWLQTVDFDFDYEYDNAVGFQFDFRFGMWQGKGHVKSHCENLLHVANVDSRSPENKLVPHTQSVACNKLGQVRHKTIGDHSAQPPPPHEKIKREKRSCCCSTCRVPWETDELNGLNMHEPGRREAMECETESVWEWDSDTRPHN